ncbi:MAG: BamA/TamA family outer membrane protein [candidate division Zixibacteria bacterium]|nr:BamA/TamA family outer membrane protein [candidate division Zixibacteria bacterium]
MGKVSMNQYFRFSVYFEDASIFRRGVYCMNRQYYVLLVIVISVCIIGGKSASAYTDQEISRIKIIIDSDQFGVVIENELGETENFSADPEELESYIGGIKVNERVSITEDGLVIDGNEVSRDKLEAVTIEKTADSPWRMDIRSYLSRYINGSSNIQYTKSENDAWLFSGIVIVDTDDIIEGSAISIMGDVEVYGKVKGDVVSVFGDVFLDSTAIVGGDVVAVTGEIITNEGADIAGRPFSVDLHPEIPKLHIDEEKSMEFNILGRYNRVTGLDLGAETEFIDRSYALPHLKMGGGYAFALKRWHYRFGFEQQFFDYYAAFFGGSFYRSFDNSDRWIIGDEENSLAAFFLREDFKDIYQREGISMFAEQWLGYIQRFQVKYLMDDYELLNKNTNWSLFGGDKDFRDNYSFVPSGSPYLDSFDGELRSLVFSYELDTRKRERMPEYGWFAHLEWEHAGGGLGGDFEYDRWWVNLQRLQPLSYRQHLNMRLVGGYSEDVLPLFKQFFIGGIGTLRGFDYKEFGGNRMLLANVEYVVNFTDFFDGIIFYDVGKAAYGDDAFRDEDFHTNLGVGLGFWESMRIDFAKPIDEDDDDLKVTVRASVSF